MACIFAVVAKMLHSSKNQRLQNERKLSIKVIVASLFSISLIEPGPVITEFERKVYEEGLKTDLTKADKVTADMFTNIYLKNYKQIFETLGQSPEDIAEVDMKNSSCSVVLCSVSDLNPCSVSSTPSRSSPWKTHRSATRQTRFTPP